MKKEHLFLIISGVLYGTVIAGGQFFVRLGLSLFEIAFYRVLIAALVLLPIVLIRRKYFFRRTELFFFILYGLIGALAGLSQNFGLVLGVPVSMVVFLIYLQPIWTILLGRLILKELITPQKTCSVGLAVAGALLLLTVWNIKSDGSILGVISAVAGGLFMSLWLILSRKSQLKRHHPVTMMFGWAFFTTIWLLLLQPIAGLFIHEPNIIRLSASFPLHYWLYLLVFVLVSALATQLFFFKGIRKIPASVAGVILLLEPVSATILAAFLFSQPISWNVLAGGSLILLSNYLVVQERKA